MVCSILKALSAGRVFTISKLKKRLRNLYEKKKVAKKLHQVESKQPKITRILENIR